MVLYKGRWDEKYSVFKKKKSSRIDKGIGISLTVFFSQWFYGVTGSNG